MAQVRSIRKWLCLSASPVNFGEYGEENSTLIPFDAINCRITSLLGIFFLPVCADNFYLLVRMVLQVQDPVTERHPGLCLRLERKSK